VNGPKSVVAGSSEKLMIVMVRPWNSPSATMMLARSGAPLHPVPQALRAARGGFHRLGSRIHRDDEVLLRERGNAVTNGLASVERPAGERSTRSRLRCGGGGEATSCPWPVH
jgi:hypothetical protein